MQNVAGMENILFLHKKKTWALRIKFSTEKVTFLKDIILYKKISGKQS